MLSRRLDLRVPVPCFVHVLVVQVGVDGEGAKAVIEANRPELKVDLVPYGALVPRLNRAGHVYIFCDANNRVTAVPSIGWSFSREISAAGVALACCFLLWEIDLGSVHLSFRAHAASMADPVRLTLLHAVCTFPTSLRLAFPLHPVSCCPFTSGRLAPFSIHPGCASRSSVP